MVAGDSAAAEALRYAKLAEAHEAEATRSRQQAGQYAVAARTEKHTAGTVRPLFERGYFMLEDRRWPGTRHANVDLILIGPGGVFIVDTKAWAEVVVAGQRLFRGDEDVTDDLSNLLSLCDLTQDELASVGLAPGEVRPVVVLAGKAGLCVQLSGIHILGERDVLRWIAGHGDRLTAAQVDAVLGKALTVFPPMGAAAPTNAAVTVPVVPLPEPSTLADAERSEGPSTAEGDSASTGSNADIQGALLSDEEVNEALMASVLAEPIEAWMSFLHPQQARLVRRTFPGPSRIRGPAGTGKTVVGLHRAAHLARIKPGRVLVTTFVRTLPSVMEQLLVRMAPDVVDRIECVGVHSFALRLLQERGVTVRLDSKRSDEAFEAAWTAAGSGLAGSASKLDRRYWRDEIDHVLKGRGITTFAEYADLPRLGRQHRLTPPGRRAVWRLYEAYDAELRGRGIHDFADLILLAEAELRREPCRDYSAVIVDEAQDMSCAMLRMLHVLVGDEVDGLTMIGDGQQSIYPGGFTLAEAGLSVANRGVILDTNYRNTAEIVRFAQQLVANDEYPDIEGVMAKGDVPASIPRRGVQPAIERHGDPHTLNSAMVRRIGALHADGVALADIAVLTLNTWDAKRVSQALGKASLPVVDLAGYDGRLVEAIKVGTIKRAKGLEFKQVLIPHVAHELASPPPTSGVDRERWDIDRRQLYVGMTRARDGLWVGLRADVRPAR